MQESSFLKGLVISMYNRYIRDHQGNFTRISEEPLFEPVCGPPFSSSSADEKNSESGWLQGILSKLGMLHVDTGDLLLLLILFLLFSDAEKRDDELLIALGLLLIL